MRVDESEKVYVIFFVEALGGAGIVLGDAHDSCSACAVEFMEALQEGKCELTDGARDFEEGEYDGAARQQISQGVGFAAESEQRKVGGELASAKISHLFVPANPRSESAVETHRFKNNARMRTAE